MSDIPLVTYSVELLEATINKQVDRIEALEAALRQVIDSIHDYERVNNLAPTPPRTECWDSVAHAIKVLAPE